MWRHMLVLKEFYGYNFRTLEDVLNTLQALINIHLSIEDFNYFVDRCVELKLNCEDSYEKCMEALRVDEQNVVNNLFYPNGNNNFVYEEELL